MERQYAVPTNIRDTKNEPLENTTREASSYFLSSLTTISTFEVDRTPAYGNQLSFGENFLEIQNNPLFQQHPWSTHTDAFPGEPLQPQEPYNQPLGSPKTPLQVGMEAMNIGGQHINPFAHSLAIRQAHSTWGQKFIPINFVYTQTDPPNGGQFIPMR